MGTKQSPADEAERNPGLPGGLEMMLASFDELYVVEEAMLTGMNPW